MYNVAITAGMTSSSFDVDIIDNMIQDVNKTFNISIRLISTCLRVIINSDTTTVTIVDDEGMQSGNFYIYILIFTHLVLRAQFASTVFNGLESSGEILLTIMVIGGIPNVNISVNIGFSEATATG